MAGVTTLAASPWLPMLKVGAYAKLAYALKHGAPPSGDGEYEKALAQLGMSVLQSRVAELMPYLKGFQLLSKDEESEFAAGFFVFDVKGALVDIPVFMSQGRIKGYQMMFMRDRQAFLPAREGLIKYLMGAQHQSIGQVGPGTTDLRPLRAAPNVDVFTSNNRYLQKTSSYPAHFDRWGRESGTWEVVNGLYDDPKTKQVFSGLKQAGKVECPQLRSLLRGSKRARAKLASWCQQSPALRVRVERHLGKNWFEQSLPKLAVAPLITPARTSILRSKIAAAPPSVSIYTGDPKANTKSAAYTDEKMEFGHFVLDTRPSTMTKQAIKIKEETAGWLPPAESGIYSVAMKDGTMKECMVILPKNNVLPSRRNISLVLDPSGNGLVAVSLSDLAVDMKAEDEMPAPEVVQTVNDPTSAKKTAEKIDSFESWVKKLSDVGNLSVPEDTYFIVIDRLGRVSEVFRSNGGSKDGVLSVYGGSIPEAGIGTDSESCCSPIGRRSDEIGPVRRLRVTDSVSSLTPMTKSVVNGYGIEMLVPKDAKILKFKQSSESTYRPATLSIMPLSDMSMNELTKTAEFKIARVGNTHFRFGRKTGVAQTRDALQTHKALLELGLSKAAAASVLRDAGVAEVKYAIVPNDSGIKQSWQLATPMYKQAYGLVPQNVGIFNGDMPETPMGMGGNMIPVPEQQYAQDMEQVPIQYADPSDPNWSSENAPYGQPMMTQTPSGGLPTQPGGEMDQGAIQQMMGSSENLFENTLFASLVNHGRVDSVLSQLTESCYTQSDRISRALFVLYAHQDEFIDRYGRTDTELLEEQCLGLLESTGDLLLELLQRSVDPSNDIALASTGQG